MDETRFRAAVGTFALATTLLLSLLLLPAAGTDDVPIFLRWTDLIGEQGLVSGYASSVANFPSGSLHNNQHINGGGEYPPFTYLILHDARVLGSSFGLAPLISFKLAIFACHWLSVALILAISGSLLLATAFSAAMLLADLGLGYIDIFYAPWLILAFWMFRRGWRLGGAGLLAVSVLVKWQPLTILPFVAVYLLEIANFRSLMVAAGRGLFWHLAGLAAATLLLLGVIFGPWPAMALLYSLGNPFLSGTALNLPWMEPFLVRLFSAPSSVIGTELSALRLPWFLLLPNRLLFWAAYLTVLVRAAEAEKTIGNCLLFSILGSFTYCTLNTGVHENHWSLALILAFILTAFESSEANRTIALVLAVMLNVNLFVFYGVPGTPLGSHVLGIDLSALFSLLNLAAWSAMVILVWRSTGTSASIRPH